ncbi:hypothetical protein HPP92_019630 [Vanilla planifolia]|uniref:BSD domain-containing protein n=2 Tax=Vanilla planifolia TaxID=51239 RepID=A0A835Q3N1_VANPL|nr:hypothetical protein HPP92_019630 [Vanilla planifolia]
MSWLARSLVNSLRVEGDGESEGEPSRKVGNDDGPDDEALKDGDPLLSTRGVKEDLSELTKSITRQLWGVASFLAPPPSPILSSSLSHPSVPPCAGGPDEVELAESPRMAGIRNDLAELGGRFKSGISMLSNSMAVSEISKIASTFLPLGDDGMEEEVEDGGKPGREAVGVTDEVLIFVRHISMHPETWLDFPFIADDDYADDFVMSDAQQDHALAVEHLEPRLGALRIELCPSHMSEGCFWKIYFVLLHSKLNHGDAELLSTPQAIQTREMLLHDLQNRNKPNNDDPAACLVSSKEDEQPQPTYLVEVETQVKPVEKSVVKEDLPCPAKEKDLHFDVSSASSQKDEDYEDGWLEDETGEVVGTGRSSVPLGDEEDVSFSDLEEEDDQGKG